MKATFKFFLIWYATFFYKRFLLNRKHDKVVTLSFTIPTVPQYVLSAFSRDVVTLKTQSVKNDEHRSRLGCAQSRRDKMTSVWCQRKLKINGLLTMFVALIFGKKKRLLRQLLSTLMATFERVYLSS